MACKFCVEEIIEQIEGLKHASKVIDQLDSFLCIKDIKFNREKLYEVLEDMHTEIANIMNSECHRCDDFKE